MDQNYLLKTKTLWPLSTALHIVCFSFLASWHNVRKVLPAQCRCTHSATSGVHCTKVLLNLQLLILPPTSSPPLQSVSTLTFFPLSRLQFSTFMNCLYKATNLGIIGWFVSLWNSMRDSEKITYRCLVSFERILFLQLIRRLRQLGTVATSWQSVVTLSSSLTSLLRSRSQRVEAALLEDRWSRRTVGGLPFPAVRVLPSSCLENSRVPAVFCHKSFIRVSITQVQEAHELVNFFKHTHIGEFAHRWSHLLPAVEFCLTL